MSFYRTVDIDGEKVKVPCFPVDSYATVVKMARISRAKTWLERMLIRLGLR